MGPRLRCLLYRLVSYCDSTELPSNSQSSSYEPSTSTSRCSPSVYTGVVEHADFTFVRDSFDIARSALLRTGISKINAATGSLHSSGSAIEMILLPSVAESTGMFLVVPSPSALVLLSYCDPLPAHKDEASIQYLSSHESLACLERHQWFHRI